MLRRLSPVLLVLSLLAGLPACASDADGGGGDNTGDGDECDPPGPAIVTDIDETLTTADEEFLEQLGDPADIPLARDGGVDLIQGYYDRGYAILYLTARSEVATQQTTGTGARELTEEWLTNEGFPMDPERTRVVLSATQTIGPATTAYKQKALDDLAAEGWSFEFGYGNATTDIDAYLGHGIPASSVFIIGEHAGEDGTVAVEGEDWVDHGASQLPTVDAVCTP